MPTIYFMGYVEPRNGHFSVEDLKPVTERDVVTGHITTFTVAILDCVISVECDVDEVRSEYISNLYTRSLELSRTMVNLISLQIGWGLRAHLDTYIDPNGKQEKLITRIDSLRGMISYLRVIKLENFFDVIASDLDLYMALDDLVGAISTPRAAATNCSRVIDAIRYMVAPEADKKAGWPLLQKALNVDKSYLAVISEKSKFSRHGRHEFLAWDEANELITRTAVIVDRYLYYWFRYKGEAPLPVDLFPELTNASTPEA